MSDNLENAWAEIKEKGELKAADLMQ